MGAVHFLGRKTCGLPVPRRMSGAVMVRYTSDAFAVRPAGLLTKASWAGPASAALLVGVWPGNLQMALDATARARRGGGRPRDLALAAGAWARMPLRIPMIRAALPARRAG